jgi:hypothetical protein
MVAPWASPSPRGNRVRLGDRGPQFGTAFGRQRLDEGGAVHLLEFEHQPRRLAVRCLQHIGFGDSGRPRQVEHDPRPARHDNPIAECLDQASPRGTNPVGKLEIDLGKVDHDAIRVGQREGAKLNRLVEVEDEAGLPVITRQPGIGCDRKSRHRRRTGDGRNGSRPL